MGACTQIKMNGAGKQSQEQALSGQVRQIGQSPALIAHTKLGSIRYLTTPAERW